MGARRRAMDLRPFHLAFPVADIAAIELTGRDTAAGKSFETWIRKWVETRRASSTDAGGNRDAHPAHE